MDATTLLKQDHDRVRSLFRKYESAGNRVAVKAEHFAEIANELEIHAQIEEKIFYPAVSSIRDDDVPDLVQEAVEEHAEVKRLLAELEGIKPGDGGFDARVRDLKDAVEHHASEEEKEMFPEARTGLGAARLERLGGEMSRMKEALRSRLVARV